MVAWRSFCETFGLRYPIMQDGMGPGPTTSLAIAVANAGGLGSVSAPGLAHPDIGWLTGTLRERLEKVASSVPGSFALNIPVGTLSTGEMLPASSALLEEALAAKLAGGIIGQRFAALTTSAGFAGEQYSERIKAAGLVHLHKVGSVKHARKAANSGVQIIIASGAEMGGHTHPKPVHTMVLAPQVIDAVDVPVIISGGIYDGRGLAAMLAAGAAGVAMGTRFIATVEHEWHENYKQYIVDAKEWDDLTYPGFYAPTRGLPTRALLEEFPKLKDQMSETEINEWKEARGRVAQIEGDIQGGIVTAGQVSAAIKSIVPVAELISGMWAQAAALLGVASDTVRDWELSHAPVQVG